MSAQQPGRWVTQQEAATELGISTEAVRMRVRRGSLESHKDEEGRVVVWVVAARSEDRTESAQATGRRADEPGPHLERLLQNQEREIEYLRSVIATRDEEIRRRDHLLAAALERIPELPESTAPQEAQSGPETGHEEPPSSGEGERYSRGWLERIRGFWRSR